MKRWIIGGAVAAFAVGVAGVAAATTGTGPALDLVSNERDGSRLRAIGLTNDQRLVSFRVDDPDEVRGIGKVSGLSGDTRLIGIDFRVQDGKLYGVGEAGGVYTLSTGDAKATKTGQFTVALNGKAFGVDFNPAADRLRVVSDAGQNLRHNVNDSTTVADTALSVPPAAGPATGVTAVAYTNNDLNADTATTLFDLDTTLDQISVQAPANSGQLSAAGKLGMDATGDAGFDIYSDVRGGRAVDATGYATVVSGGKATLYEVSLVTGRAEALGGFPRRSPVIDLALPLNQ